MRRDYEHLAGVARQELRRGITDTGVCEVESQPSNPTERRAEQEDVKPKPLRLNALPWLSLFKLHLQ